MHKIEVEVETLAQVEEAVAAGADAVLLDNMDLETMAEAVRLVGGRALVEASGGIRPETVAQVARTGVDVISLGWITHSAPALDLSLLVTVERHEARGAISPSMLSPARTRSTSRSYCAWIRRVTGPGRPSPTGRPSTETTAITSTLVLEMKSSSTASRGGQRFLLHTDAFLLAMARISRRVMPGRTCRPRDG